MRNIVNINGYNLYKQKRHLGLSIFKCVKDSPICELMQMEVHRAALPTVNPQRL